MKYELNGSIIDSEVGSPVLEIPPGDYIPLRVGDVINGLTVPVDGVYSIFSNLEVSKDK